MSDEYRDDGAFPPDPDPYNGDESPPTPPVAPTENLPPWEDRTAFSWLAGFVNTVPRVMTAPGRFFTDHPTRRGFWGPVTFGVLMGVIVAIAEWIWSRAFSGFVDTLYELLGEDYEVSAMEDALITFFESFGVFASPFRALVMLFLVAGVVHLALMLIASDTQKGFEATLRATAYAQAASILALIPFCGSYIGILWTMSIAVIGIRTIHGIGTGQALLAVFGPMVLCCCGCTGIIVLTAMIAAS